MPNQRSVFLVIHPGSLGDSLLALEGVRALKRQFPDRRFVWMGQAVIGDLLVQCREVDESVSLEGQYFGQLYFPPEQWTDPLKALLEPCTHCVGWLNDSDGAIKENLTSFGIEHVMIQSPKSANLERRHAEDRFLEILKPLGVTGTSQKRTLRLPFDLKNFQRRRDWDEFLESRDSQFLVMHPGSGSLHKCVPPSLLRKVAASLRQNQKRALVILKGPADEEAVDNLISEMGTEDYTLVKEESLLSVAYLLNQATLYIGHDSGITHLASLLGVPCIALFGPTDPGRWAPRGDHVSVIRGPFCQCTHWKDVQECHSKPCLHLSVDLILQQAERLLESQSRETFFHRQGLDIAQEV